MALRSQKVGIPLAGGLDEEAHDFILSPPSHARVTNLEHTEDGALVRRDELHALATASGNVEAIAGFEKEGVETLVVFTDAGAKVLVGDVAQDAGALSATDTDGPRSVDIRRHPIIRSSEGATAAFSAAAAGYVCHVWTRGRDDDDGAIWVRIDDMETGQPLYGPAIVPGMDAGSDTGGAHVAPVQANNAGVFVVATAAVDDGTTRSVRFVVFGRETNGSAAEDDPIASKVYRVINGAVGPGTTTTLAPEARYCQYAADPSEEKVFVAGWNGTDWRIYEYDGSGLALSLNGSLEVTGITDNDFCLALCHGVTSQRLMAVFADSPDLEYVNVSTASALSGSVATAAFYSPSGSAPATPTNAAIVEVTSGFSVVYQGATGTVPADFRGIKALIATTSGTLASSTGREAWNVLLAAQPFVDDDGNTIIPLVADAFRARSTVGDRNPSRSSRRQAYLAQVDGAALRRICEFGQDVAQVSGLEGQSGAASVKRVSHTHRLRSDRGWGFPLMLAEVDTFGIVPGFTDSFRLQSAGYVVAEPGAQHVRTLTAAGAALASSGYLAKVDGERCGEVMQLPPPEFASVTQGAGPQDYSMRLCWAWRDAEGVLHRSAPGEQTTFEGGSDIDLTISVPPFLDWWSQQGLLPTDLWLEVYGSPQTDLGSGGVTDGVHYRRPISISENTDPHTTLGHLDDPSYAIRLADIYQSSTPWVSATVYVDFTVDGELLLYTDGDGGQLDHDPVPCPVDVAASRDRLWVIDAEDRQSAWYTVPLANGFAPAFSQLLQVRVPTSAGDLTALGVIDDLVVLFGSSGIYAVEAIGGPDSTGAGAFPPLRRLSTERGCINPASVITTDAGLLFQADDGLWSIDGAGNMTPIGRAVRNTLTGRTIVSSCVVSKKQQAIWLLDNDTALVFDMEAGAWALHDYTAEDDGYTACGIHDGRLVLGTSDGALHRADPALPLVDSADIDVGLTTGWIKLAGLQGFKRVRRMGILGRLATGEESITPDTPPTHVSDLGELSVSVWYDYDDASSPDVYTLDMTESSGVVLDPFHWRIPLARQKCKAIKVAIDYDAPALAIEPSGTWEDYPLRVELVGLALEVGIKGGIQKIGHGAGGTVT